MQPFEGILCMPGYRARYVEVPATREGLRKAVGGTYRVSFPFPRRRIALVCNARNYGPGRFEDPGLRPNRAHPDDGNAIPVRFYCGNILLLGYDGGKGAGRTFRSLEPDEASFVMGHFGRPDFPRPIFLGLTPGEGLEIVSGMEFEARPEQAIVVSEREGFVTVRLYFHGLDRDRGYVATLNKNSILCGQLKVVRKSTMEDLWEALLYGGAVNPADYVSKG